eukprot:1151760-Pelagomonas_calceolata.AAC.11
MVRGVKVSLTLAMLPQQYCPGGAVCKSRNHRKHLQCFLSNTALVEQCANLKTLEMLQVYI